MSVTLPNSLIKLKWQMMIRRGKVRVIALFVIITFYMMFIGLLDAFLAESIEHEGNFTFGKDQALFFLLMALLLIVGYLIISGVTGNSNPFITSREDAYLVQRIPIEPSHMFRMAFSTKLLQLTFILALLCILDFLPPLFILRIPAWHLIFIFLALFICFLTALFIEYALFFVFKGIRRKNNWIQLFASSSPIIGIPIIAVLLLFLLEGQYGTPSYDVLGHLDYVPILNSGISVIGFLLRGGIPSPAWIAFFISLVECGLIGGFVLFEMRSYSLDEDINAILPILEITEMRRTELIGRFKLSFDKTNKILNFKGSLVGKKEFINNSWPIVLSKTFLLGISRTTLYNRFKSLIILILIFLVTLFFISDPQFRLLIQFTLIMALSSIPELVYAVDQQEALSSVSVDSNRIAAIQALLIGTVSAIFLIPIFIVTSTSFVMILLAIGLFVLYCISAGLIARTSFKYSKLQLIAFLPILAAIIVILAA